MSRYLFELCRPRPDKMTASVSYVVRRLAPEQGGDVGSSYLLCFIEIDFCLFA
jgi:hypothetical protein